MKLRNKILLAIFAVSLAVIAVEVTFLISLNSLKTRPLSRWEEFVKDNLIRLKDSPIIIQASWDSYLNERGALKSLILSSTNEFIFQSVEEQNQDITGSFNGYKPIAYKSKVSFLLPNKEPYSVFFTESDLEVLKIFKRIEGKEVSLKLEDLIGGDKILYTHKKNVLTPDSPLIEGVFEVVSD